MVINNTHRKWSTCRYNIISTVLDTSSLPPLLPCSNLFRSLPQLSHTQWKILPIVLIFDFMLLCCCLLLFAVMMRLVWILQSSNLIHTLEASSTYSSSNALPGQVLRELHPMRHFCCQLIKGVTQWNTILLLLLQWIP